MRCFFYSHFIFICMLCHFKGNADKYLGDDMSTPRPLAEYLAGKRSSLSEKPACVF